MRRPCTGQPDPLRQYGGAQKYFWDGTIAAWQNGLLAGKPACVFTSSTSQHGGNEATLLSMMLPLLHHGMLITGLPFYESELATTTTGGTPYGASHVAGHNGGIHLSESENNLAYGQGRRLAIIAKNLSRP